MPPCVTCKKPLVLPTTNQHRNFSDKETKEIVVVCTGCGTRNTVSVKNGK